MPDSCEVLTEEFELALEELELAEEACDETRMTLAADYSDAVAAVEALETRQEILQAEAEQLRADSDALQNDLPEDDCGELEQTWTQADAAMGETNAAWNALIFDYQAAWQAYDDALEDYEEIYNHLIAAQEQLDLVLAQIAELESILGADESSSELDALREQETQLQEDVADLTESDAAAYVVVQATEAASAAFLDDLEAADIAAIEAESNEQAAWEAWQACLVAQQDREMLEEIALRQAEIEAELEDIAAELELAYEARELLEIVTGQTWVESMAECFRTTDVVREDIAELQRKLTTHGC